MKDHYWENLYPMMDDIFIIMTFNWTPAVRNVGKKQNCTYHGNVDYKGYEGHTVCFDVFSDENASNYYRLHQNSLERFVGFVGFCNGVIWNMTLDVMWWQHI